MQCTVHPKTLASLLDLCVKFIAKNTTLPILTNVYLQTKMNTLLLRATDMEKYIEITMPAVVGTEGALTVDAKTFRDIIKSLDTDTVSLDANATNDNLTIKSKKDKFTIKGIAASEYVALPDLQALHTIRVPAKTLATGVNKVEYAVMEKNFSPIFTGIYLRFKQEQDGPKLIFVGTDSFLLAEYKTSFTGDIGDKPVGIIIPKNASIDMMSVANYCVAKDPETTVELLVATNLVGCSFMINDISIRTTSILIQGTFPDYENEKIMPKTFLTTVQIDAYALDKEIKKIGIMAKDVKNFISMNFAGDTLYIDSGQTEKGDGLTQMSISKTGDDIALYINGKYFNDFIRNMTNANLHLGIVNTIAPVTLSSPDDSNYRAIIRPITK